LNYCKIPIVVIGGINEKNIPNFKNYNISGYAMVSSILGKDNITESTLKLKEIILLNNRHQIH